jgi:tetratricopeptide (TPR) repeat protein
VIPQDAPRIFNLLYTRLACLTLIDATSLAAQEVKALEDLNNTRMYVDEDTGEHLVPWELRVLNVRLQALGFGDSRRAVMSYHELAREARERISKAMAGHDNSARELWKSRLYDLGIKVAGALIEMDDLAGAAHHLASLPSRGDSKNALSKALLWLQLGDADQARECAKECAGGPEEAENTEVLIQALCDMADAEYEASLANWERLQDLDDEMIAINTAVCLLYLGRMSEVGCPQVIPTQYARSHRKPGSRNTGEANRSRTNFTYTSFQPINNVRALHREESRDEDEARREGREYGGAAIRMGKVE